MQENMQADLCSSCALAGSRREFIGEALRAALGVLLMLGGSTADADASLSWIRADRRAGAMLTYPLPGSNGVQIDAANEVILACWEGSVYAFSLACPHQHTALHWLASGGRFQCPKHKSKYQPDGTYISGRATRSMDRFSVRREGGNVVVDLSALHREPDDPAAWKNAVVKLNS